MRIWFPAAPDGTIDATDRSQFGLGSTLSFAVSEVIWIGPIPLTVRGAVASQALSVRGPVASQALSTYTRPASISLTVRDEVTT